MLTKETAKGHVGLTSAICRNFEFYQNDTKIRRKLAYEIYSCVQLLGASPPYHLTRVSAPGHNSEVEDKIESIEDELDVNVATRSGLTTDPEQKSEEHNEPGDVTNFVDVDFPFLDQIQNTNTK